MSVGFDDGKNQQPNSRQGDPADWDSIKGEVNDMAGAAVERGRHFLDAARDQATVYVDRRKDAVAQSVADFATSLRDSTTSFDDRPNIRAVVDSAAEGLDQLADSIRERSFQDIFNEAEELVRHRPGAVAAVTVALGFLTARFIKASAESLRQDYRPQASRSPAGRPRTASGQRGPATRPGQGA